MTVFCFSLFVWFFVVFFLFFFSKIYIPLKLLDIIFILIFFKDIPLHNAASQRLSSCVTFISRSVGERETIDVGDFIPVFTGVCIPRNRVYSLGLFRGHL